MDNLNKNKRQIILILALTIIFLITLMLVLRTYRINNDKQNVLYKGQLNSAELSIGQNIFKAEIADTDTKRELGLGGRLSIAIDSVMLFTFDKLGRYGFWMKDMSFPIDIVWVSDDNKINTIYESVAANTFPKVFYPTYDSKYVLEFASGTVSSKMIKIGDEIKIKFSSPN